MTKEEIYVEITSEEERLKSIDILEKAGEEILKNSDLFIKFMTGKLCYKNRWSLPTLNYTTDRIKITLYELEKLLQPKVDVLIDNFKKECHDKGYNVSVTIESEVLKDNDFVRAVDKANGNVWYGVYKQFQNSICYIFTKASKEEILKYFEL